MTLAASEDEAIFAGGPPSSPPAKNLFFVAVLLRPRQRKSIGIVFSGIKNPPTPPTETTPLHLSLSQRATCLALVYAIEPLRLSYLRAAPPHSISPAHQPLYFLLLGRPTISTLRPQPLLPPHRTLRHSLHLRRPPPLLPPAATLPLPLTSSSGRDGDGDRRRVVADLTAGLRGCVDLAAPGPWINNGNGHGPPPTSPSYGRRCS